MSKTKKWLKNAAAYILGVGSVHTGLALSRIIKKEIEFVPEDDDDIFADYDEFEEIEPEVIHPDNTESDDERLVAGRYPWNIEQKPDIQDLMERDEEYQSTLHVRMPEAPEPPHMISVSEYGMKMDDDYEAEHLIYHANGVLVDFQDIRVDNPVDLIGQEALSRLINCKSIYDNDAVVWVRNDKYRTDYEIEWDEDPFNDYGSFDEE